MNAPDFLVAALPVPAIETEGGTPRAERWAWRSAEATTPFADGSGTCHPSVYRNDDVAEFLPGLIVTRFPRA